jgi:putative CocE/NonD family hydrolase
MLKEDARRLDLHEASDTLEQAWANLPAQYLQTPYGMHPAIQAEGLPTYVLDWMKHDEPGAYWESMDISRTVAKIRVPALHVSGWYDTYLKGSVDGFNAMRAHTGSADARDHQYLLAGPWVHIPWGDRIGPHALGSEANLDTDTLLLRWFNHWLKDTNEFAGEPRIRHFALNENKWHSAADWPATRLDLYLHSGGRANASKGDGLLTPDEPGAAEAPDVFVYDPEVPVVAPGGLPSTAGPTNQALLEMGNNVLVYTSAPLEAAMHVFGSAEVSLSLTTSAADSDVVVKLICVHTNGDAQFVCIGIARSRFLFTAYSADRTHLWKFSLEPTSCVFPIGARLRVEIASSAYPLFDRNAGTDIPARDASAWNWRRSTQTLFHDARRPSILHLPINSSRQPR